MTQDIDLIAQARRTQAPKDMVQAFLVNSGKDKVQYAAEQLVAEDAIYTSLNLEVANSPELAKIEPWTGTRKGRQVYIDTFSNVGTYWQVNDFQVTTLIAEAQTVAVFGQFTYTSVEVGTQFTSPFSILARVDKGQIVFLQFMEDTYASASSFRVSGQWEIRNNGKTFFVGH